MIYIFYWLVCSVSSFYLLKTYVSSNLRRVDIQDASIATAMRNAAKKDVSDDVSYAPPDDCPDNVYSAVFWTVILVINLFTWPLCLCILVSWYINKQDFSDFRGE